MESLRLQGNALFASDPAAAAELYLSVMKMFEELPLAERRSAAMEEFTKSAGNALTCLYKIGKLSECATTARRALRVNPVLAKANAFLGRCLLQQPTLAEGEVEVRGAFTFMCRAMHILPAMAASLQPDVEAAIVQLASGPDVDVRKENVAALVRVERGSCGSCAMAAVELPPMTIVSQTNEPFSVGPYEDVGAEGCCVACSALLQTPRRCARCEAVFFCSAECERRYARQHDEFECGRYVKLKEMCASIAERNMDVPAEFYDIAAHCITTMAAVDAHQPGYEEVLSRLESHTQEVVQSLHPAAALIAELFPTHSPELVARVLGVLRCNALEVADESGLGVGQALHTTSTTSFFNHSCRPNCAINAELNAISTLRHVAAGEELTIAYIPQLYWPAALRQEALSSHYFFSCRCRRCVGEDPFELAVAMELPTTAAHSANAFDARVQTLCQRIRSQPAENISEKDLIDIDGLEEELHKHVFDAHYLHQDLHNVRTFVCAVLGKSIECLASCLQELLLWECIVPGALPVKQLKLMNALRCLTNVSMEEVKEKMGSNTPALLPHLHRLAALYGISE